MSFGSLLLPQMPSGLTAPPGNLFSFSGDAMARATPLPAPKMPVFTPPVPAKQTPATPVSSSSHTASAMQLPPAPESKGNSSAASANFVINTKYVKQHIQHHYADANRGSTHSVFINKNEVNGIIDAVVERIKTITATWKTPSDKGRKVTLDLGRVIGFQGEALGQANNYPTTSTVEAFYDFKYDASTDTRSIILKTLYPCKEYNKGTLDQNGYTYVKGKAIPK